MEAAVFRFNKGRTPAPKAQPGQSRPRAALRRGALIAGLVTVALAALAGNAAPSRAAGGHSGPPAGAGSGTSTPPLGGQPASLPSVGGRVATPLGGSPAHGTPQRVPLHKAGASAPHAAAAPRQANAAPRSLPLRFPHASPQTAAAHAATAATTRSAPVAVSSVISNPATGSKLDPHTRQVQSVDGLNSIDNANANGYVVEPPDQGLCASGSYTVEMLNDVGGVYTSSGARIAKPFDLNSFFNENPAEFLTDPRCYYDASANAWFATTLALGVDPNTNNIIESHVDIAVNASANPLNVWTVYFFDTTDASGVECPCFGDQPLLGVDSTGVYISTNEFSGSNSNQFNGAQLYMLSKSQLLQGVQSPVVLLYDSLSYAGIFTYQGADVGSVQPAQTPAASPAEYFLASNDPNGTVDTTLFAFAMSNEQAINSNSETDFPVLSGVAFQGQVYGFPPNAAQAGNTGFAVATDDDRMQQVVNLNGTLYSSLDTVVKIPGDAVNRSGAAWYQVVPQLGTDQFSDVVVTGATIKQQGIMAVSGSYLLYPAVAPTQSGRPVMVMTLSSAQMYPSAIWSDAPFSYYIQAATGAAADQGFTCSPPYSEGVCRWGDYSAAVIVPGTNNLWLATEYISAAAPVLDQNNNVLTNWATRLIEINAR
jgi:hypothetical protein